MANARRTHGKHMANARQTQGKRMANAWQTQGKRKANAWQTHGKRMANAWQTHGKRTANAWRTQRHGISKRMAKSTHRCLVARTEATSAAERRGRRPRHVSPETAATAAEDEASSEAGHRAGAETDFGSGSRGSLRLERKAWTVDWSKPVRAATPRLPAGASTPRPPAGASTPRPDESRDYG